MATEGKANTMDAEHNLERPISPQGMLKSFVMTHAFKNRPLRSFQLKLKSKNMLAKSQVDERFSRTNTLSEALRQFSKRTFSKRRSMSLQPVEPGKEKTRKWSALSMTLPSSGSGDQGGQASASSLSSSTFTVGSSIPAFSLPDQASIFNQTSSEQEKPAPKPKWKPPEPGARRFSRIEEIQPSSGMEISSTLEAPSSAATPVQKSSKPGGQAATPKPSIARPDASAKPTQASVRQILPPSPISEKPLQQASPLEATSPRRAPGQLVSNLSEPEAKTSQASTRETASAPSQALPLTQTPPAEPVEQAALEPKVMAQAPAQEEPQAASQSQIESQASTTNRVLPQAPSQLPTQASQMPLAPRRQAKGLKKSRQALVSKQSYPLSRPKLAVRKATLAIQRKSPQLPLKKRQIALPSENPAAVQNLKPTNLPASQQLTQPETSLPVAPKALTLPSSAPKIQAESKTTGEQPAAPGLQTPSKTMPLQPKSLHLPLKRPVLATRKPSPTQNRRLNLTAMPLKKAPARPQAAKGSANENVEPTSATMKLPAEKQVLRSQTQSSEPAQTKPPIRALEALDISTSPMSSSALGGKPNTDAGQTSVTDATPSGSRTIENTEVAPTPELARLSLPLINKSLLHKVSSRRQMLPSRPIARWQEKMASLPSYKAGLSPVSRLPGLSIQRSPRKGYPIIPTRIFERHQAALPRPEVDILPTKANLRAETAHFKSVLPAEKFVPDATIKKVPLRTQPPLQRGTQAQSTPRVAFQPSRKAVSKPAVPEAAKQKTIPNLAALRKGKPVFTNPSAGITPENSANLKPGRPNLSTSRSIGSSPQTTRPITPIHSIQSSSVVQRSPNPEEEHRQAQTPNLNLPLASQFSPQIGPASQNQGGFAPSNGRNASGQSAQLPQQQPTPQEPPLPAGYSNPFAAEEGPEMPLRTPPRAATFESPEQPDLEMPDLSGSMFTESQAADSDRPTPPPTEEQKRANLQELARKVYPEIIRMLNTETEWLGRRL